MKSVNMAIVLGHLGQDPVFAMTKNLVELTQPEAEPVPTVPNDNTPGGELVIADMKDDATLRGVS